MWYKDGKTFSTNNTIREYEGLTYNTGLPAIINDSDLISRGYVKVVIPPQPTISNVQVASQSTVVLDALGVPTMQWVVQDMFKDIPIGTPDINGIPSTVVVTKLQQETAYLAKLASDAQASTINHFTVFTDNYIQAKIDAYNLANNVAFAKIENFAKYLIATDTRYAIATRFLTWNGKIWDAVTTLRNTAISTGVIPTDAAFKAALDAVVF